MRRDYLTQAEIDTSDAGPQYVDVTPAQLFSSNADANLAARVLRKNPRRYPPWFRFFGHKTDSLGIGAT
jgi:hypothetical protein